jgi:regulation of enolase protein 1 (concanavalin A-like superfamily)
MCRKLIYPSLLMLVLAATAAQAADYTWIRTYYYDSRYATAWQGASTATQTALAAAGYTVLNADALKTWMDARIADKKLSVVVLCQDAAPDTVTETMSNTCTLRKYLDAGGKIVWYADIPFYYQSNATATNTQWGDAGAPAILGFNTSGATRETYNVVTITPLGKTWGLTQTWQSRRPAVPTVTPNLDILATDNAGNAAAWVKHYVPNDTFRGFVRIFDQAGQANVDDIMRVAEYIGLKASNPQPADGATSVTMPLLQWSASSFAIFHNVYLGTTPDLTAANLVSSNQPIVMYFHVPGLQPGTTYYWRIDEVEADGTVRMGDVWKFTATPKTAWAPAPGDGAMYVAANATLTWTAGMNAMTHDVYFSADRAAVESGAAAAKKGDKQPVASYTPTGLEAGKTYYWRVDENAIGGTVAGAVWSFTVRPVIAKTDPSLVGWWKLDDEKSGVAVDYSGYDNYGMLTGGPTFAEGYLGDALSFDGVNDFVDCGNDASLTAVDSVSVAAWIKVGGLGRDQKVGSNQNNSSGGYKLGVYTNNLVEFEIRTAANAATLNRNVTGGTVLDRDVWYHVVGVYNKGKSIRTYVNGKLDRELLTADVAGVSNGPFRLGRESFSTAYWWLGLMDDVRVYNKALTDAEIQKVMQGDPLMAWAPQPATGATLDIRNATSLSWSAGEGAAKHDVYFGKDKDAVKIATTTSPLYQGRQTGTSFSLAGLVDFGGGAYFWRIDEVEADGITVHKGIVWSFTVPGYFLVDDMESYNDTDNRIYDTWIDNFDPKGDGSGSVVGNDPAPFAERTIVHGGRQSLPMSYNNAGPKFSFSETCRVFSPPENWTGNGVTYLSIWFRGNPVRFLDKGNGAFTVGASGHDIWDNADDFRFVYKSLSGNGSVTVKVDSLVNTNAWAKAGVMIRESLDAGSPMAYMIQSFSSGASFGWRLTTGATCGSQTQASIVAPQWVKLTRTGNAFTAQYSADGKAWTDIKNATGQVVSTTINMAANVYIGLCVTSHDAALTTTAQFSGAATTGTVTGQWQQAWIGDDPDRTNDPGGLYVTIEDSAAKVVVVTHPDPMAANISVWTEWKIPLSSLTGVNLAKVKKVCIGVGDRKAPVPGGSGRIFIDDIQVTKP